MLLTFGLYHPEVVSTNTLLRIVQDLICENFLEYRTANSDFELELHLQCIVSGLRLLSRHGIYPGSGNVTFELFDKLYNRLSHWSSYLAARVQVKDSGYKRNYNAEFLLVFAKDLITSLPNDRTLTRNVLKRVLAACTTVGLLVLLLKSVGITNQISIAKILFKLPGRSKWLVNSNTNRRNGMSSIAR